MPFHIAQTLGMLNPVVDPVKGMQTLADLQGKQIQNVGAQQTVDANAAAAAKQKQLQQVFAQPGAFGADGKPTPATLNAVRAIDPDHADKIEAAFLGREKTREEIKTIPTDAAARTSDAASRAAEVPIQQQNADTAAGRLTYDQNKPLEGTPGSQFVNPQDVKPGQPVTVPATAKVTPQPTAGIQEYEYAKAQGYKGTFEQYQKEDANRKDPSSTRGSFTVLTDKEGNVIGAVNPLTSTYKTSEQMGVPSDAKKGAMSPERQKMQANAQSGLRAIDKFKTEIAKPGVLAALAVPGSPTAKLARAARNEMVDVLTRLRTGAALNAGEQAFYNGQAPGLLDSLLNDPETIPYKLSIFEEEFKSLAGGSSAAAQGQAGSPKVGDIKKFANGKTGKWDGHGWVQQ